MANEPPLNYRQICRKCNRPVDFGMKFCELCGTRIELPPACPQCSAPLAAGVKFCETCGKPVAAYVAPPVSAVPPIPVPEAVQATPAPEPMAATSAPAPAGEVKKPALPQEPAAAASEIIVEKSPPEKPEEPVQKITEKAPASSTRNLVIAGVVGLVIVAVLAYVVLLPMLSGPGAAGQGTSGTLPAFPAPSSGTPGPAAVSFITEPTEVPPPNLLVTFQAERDPLSGLVTVTFTGGAGQHGVSDVSIRLSRSDGQVLTKSFKPQQIGSFIALQGTKMTDRIEVIVHYYNGDKYRIIDQLFEYKKKF